MGNVSILDSFAPGNAGAASVEMQSVAFGPTAKLLMELGGEAAGSQNDAVTASISAVLAGTLQVTLANGFVPEAGDRFALISSGSLSGTFATSVLPVVPNLHFAVVYSPTGVTLAVTPALAGDYHADGQVNGNDFLLWQRTLGSTTQLAADGNGNGVIDAGDYEVWQGNLGAAASSAASIGVPEPRAIVFILWVGVALLTNRPRMKNASRI
jgi:hypothetical protein